ncbi:hypothetical protein FNV43_RR24467 [Rhamnella rubrinervis]|uniref:BUB1 N-terminal domain-containing protein n=1 Tax=Rhamnella rubrinervis TaxID=2594499 RepID=A0A8K0DT46_9ROSA|nr:hypothetical protein FNV43_RR24467 [Rhamnella rubrinervis]
MANNNDLFMSLVSDIKSYTGKDPLLPWIRGIRKMKDSLPPHFLKEKLPRFLQKCAQKFESDPRYRNDLRYLRVWLQLMDFVDDPKGLLRTMEANSIGTKHSLFYQAYALYYEKNKKFEEAEKMYHLGVQNLAEPLDGLQKSYEQFLHRMERHKNQRIKRTKRIPDDGSHFVKPLVESNHTDVSETPCNARKVIDPFIKKELIENKHHNTAERVSDEPEMFCSDKTVVSFVDTAIVGKSDAEDACHHGLVDPTINMKEAINAINSMFREPLETVPVRKKLHQRQQKDDDNLNGGFKVFVDENLDNGSQLADQKKESFPQLQHSRKGTHQPYQEPFSIFIDDEENDECRDSSGEKDNSDHNDFSNLREGSDLSASHANMFVFPIPKDLPSESSGDFDVERIPQSRFREDTVVCRFVGSTISDEPEVENVCHHGLVEPTINLKEAMEDINNMFGKPMEFVRTKRAKKQDKVPDTKNDFGGFTILPDDDCEHQPVKTIPKSSGKSRGCDLFEPTVFTKEAMDDINKMFGMPLDF